MWPAEPGDNDFNGRPTAAAQGQTPAAPGRGRPGGRASAAGSKNRSDHESKAGARAMGVVQSALHLRSHAQVNQYRLVSQEPIGKGFQSKVYLVEASGGGSTRVHGSSPSAATAAPRRRFAMKILNTRRALRMASRDTDSDLLGCDAAASGGDGQGGEGSGEGGGEVWIEVQVARLVR
eukprot:COSAG01_NODE_10490_length_2152_cov_5.256698_1_plen_178_part_00